MIYVIAREIERNLGRIANELARIADDNEKVATKLARIADGNQRIGTMLDNLWSPLKGINTVLWEKSGIDPSLGADD